LSLPLNIFLSLDTALVRRILARRIATFYGSRNTRANVPNEGMLQTNARSGIAVALEGFASVSEMLTTRMTRILRSLSVGNPISLNPFETVGDKDRESISQINRTLVQSLCNIGEMRRAIIYIYFYGVGLRHPQLLSLSLSLSLSVGPFLEALLESILFGGITFAS